MYFYTISCAKSERWKVTCNCEHLTNESTKINNHFGFGGKKQDPPCGSFGFETSGKENFYRKLNEN